MTAIANLPDLRPSLLLDFGNSGRVDPRIQCTRASAATCFGPDGKLRTVAANVPRIDYDPATGKCKGLLIEESRANLLKYSEDFGNAVWSKYQASITPNVSAAPDGTTSSADKLVEAALTGSHFVVAQSGQDMTAGATYTMSVMAKAGERSLVELRCNDTTQSRAIFSLTDGTQHYQNNILGAGSVDVGNGWWRVWISFIAEGPTSSLRIGLAASTSNNSYTGDGTSGLYIWGAQLEQGAFPTSYIPTGGSTVSRAADLIAVSTPGWFTPEAFSIFVSLTRITTANVGPGGTPLVPRVLSMGSSSVSSVQLRINSASSLEGITPAGYNAVPWTPGSPMTFGLGFDRDGATLVNNASGLSVDTTVDVLTGVNTLTLGSTVAGIGHIGQGWFHTFRHYPKRLSNEQLSRLAKS